MQVSIIRNIIILLNNQPNSNSLSTCWKEVERGFVSIAGNIFSCQQLNHADCSIVCTASQHCCAAATDSRALAIGVESSAQCQNLPRLCSEGGESNIINITGPTV